MSAQKISAVIIDDMELARISLRADIEDHCPEIDIIGEAEGVVSGAKLIKGSSPDLIFLDIEMKDGDGFDLLDIVPDSGSRVIFVTGSEEYALKAFRYSAADYLVKPVDRNQLKEAVRKAGMDIALNGVPKEIHPLTIGVTGYGNVANGAQEILDLLPVINIKPDELQNIDDSHPSNMIYRTTFTLGTSMV